MVKPVVYYVADVVTGTVLDTLPISGEVAKTRGEVESASWELPIPDVRVSSPVYTEDEGGARTYTRNDAWATLLQPWRVMIVAEWRGRLIQGWVVVSDTFGNPTLPLQGATLERLLERVYVRDGEWYSVDLAQTAAEIVTQVLVPEGGWEVQWQETGTVDDTFHEFGSQKSVYAALEELQAAEGGPVWMCDVSWVPGEEGRQVQKTVHIAASLGDIRPEAIFRARPGEYTRMVDWSGDNAALEVWGITEGSGGEGITETSYRSTKLDEGWHPNEQFVSFTDLDDEQLELRRDRRGRELEDGTVVWEATLRIDEQPILGDEWNIGDTVTLEAKSGPYDPQGASIAAEVEGFVLDADAGTIVLRMIQEGAEDE